MEAVAGGASVRPLSHNETLSQGFGSAGVPPAVWRASRPPIGPAGGRRYPGLLQCLDRGRPFPGSNVVALELAIKRGPADAQHLARERLVTLHLLEDPLDGGALDVLKVGRGQPG